MRSPPMKISMMLHFYAIVTPYAEHHPTGNSEAYHEFVRDLLKEDMIKPDSTSGSGYKATDKGRAWVDMICSTPHPVLAWVCPK